MRSLLLIIVSLFCTQATAGWSYRKVCDTVQVPVQVKVYPQPVMKMCNMGCQHVVQPEPFWEQQMETRTEWHWEKYWIPDPIYTTPYYSAPAPYVESIPTPAPFLPVPR